MNSKIRQLRPAENIGAPIANPKVGLSALYSSVRNTGEDIAINVQFNDYLIKRPLFLKEAVNGDEGREMSDPPSKSEVDAKIAASEARGETSLARLEGRIDTLAAQLAGKVDALSEKISADHNYAVSTRWTLIITFITGMLAVAGLIVGMATYGDALFSRGMSVHQVIQDTIRETLSNQRPAAK